MRPPQGWEWLILLLIVLLLFGSAKLPELARGMGRSLRILKEETSGKDHPGQEKPPPSTPSGNAPTG